MRFILVNVWSSLVMMIDDFPPEWRELPFSFYFDNLFTSLPLLNYLKARGYNGTGTIRENRIPSSCPLPDKKEFKKEARGKSISSKVQGTTIRVTKWMDNAVVTMASSCNGIELKAKAPRYSKQARSRITVDQPYVVAQYNKYMGGVDRMDQNVSLYRTAYKGKKWWSIIFTWLLDVCLQNAWVLHRKTHPNMSQLEFKRHIARYYCDHYGKKPVAAGRPSTVRRSETPGTVDEVLRYDHKDHFVDKCAKRRRCVGELCQKRPFTQCNKCDVGLCANCFTNYHTKD